MQHQSVTSSNISSIGYDAASRTLEVTFHNGGTYAYSGVPQSEYDALMAASSHGSYLNSNIKSSYTATKR